MRSSFITLLTCASAALAAPLAKRDVTWVTVFDEVEVVQTVVQVQTVIVYATAIDDPSPTTYFPEPYFSTSEAAVAPTSTVENQQLDGLSSVAVSTTETTPTSVYVEPTSTSVYVAPTSTSVYVEPTSTSVYVEPTSTSVYVEPTTTSVYVEPTPTSVYVAPSSSSVYVEPSSSSVYVAPTTTSVYVAPTTSSTSEYVAPTTTSVYVAPSTTSATPTATSSPSSGGSGTYSGDGTFYSTGLGSCGITSTDSDYIVAISNELMSASANGNPNTNPLCGQTITAYRGDKSVKVTVVDTCMGCAEYDLDFSPAAFDQLGEESEGRISITWSWDS